MKTLLVAIAALVGLAALAAAAGYAGLYNVAADDPHWNITERALQAVRERSIETRASEIAPPGDIASEKRVAAGAPQYAEMCEGCHLAPGVEESELRRGLYPKPPELARERLDAREAFWVLKHGVKMTGMPAWGPTHDDETLWNVVAFLQKLPELDANAYRDLVAKQEKASPGHSHAPGTPPHRD